MRNAPTLAAHGVGFGTVVAETPSALFVVMAAGASGEWRMKCELVVQAYSVGAEGGGCSLACLPS
ncbi:hypothetical protein ACWDBD_43860 [Streptomyces sp. NPDC001118]|uniref:hypothetical protein n=1 Tax=Streptomyces sp. NPDC002589 TaxID=3154420 RepID=UPI00332FE429